MIPAGASNLILFALDTDILTLWRYGNADIGRRIGHYVRFHGTPPALTSTTMLEVFLGFEAKVKKAGSLTWMSTTWPRPKS